MSTISQNKGSIAFIAIGVLNILHASLHLIQFIQSIVLISASASYIHHEDEGFLEGMLHNPYLNILWAAIGVFTLYLGVRDFKHHKKCSH